MDPLTLSLIIGGSLTVLGGVLQGVSQANEMAREAERLRKNAERQRQAALSTLQVGAIAASDRLRRAGREQSRARVFLGSRGVSGGTADRIREAVGDVGKIDADRIELNAALEAWGFKTIAFDMETEARRLDEAQAPTALTTIAGGVLSALPSFIKAV